MATRFRLPSAGTAPISPATQSYTHGGSTRFPLPLTDSSTLTNTTLAPDAADHLVAGDVFVAQFVSERLRPGIQFTNADAINLAVQCFEDHPNNNLGVQLYVAIVTESGSVQRVIRSKVVDNVEVVNSVLTNRNLTTTQDGATYTTVKGDRLVVELSFQGTPVATGGVQGHNATMRLGSDGAGGDLGANDTDTGTTLNPWIDFAPTITFDPVGASPGPNPVLVPKANQLFFIPRMGAVLETSRSQPFSQTEWPKLDRRVSGLAVSISTSQSPADVQSQVPFAQPDWPNPTSRSIQPQSALAQRSNVLDVVATGNPFSQTEWSNPLLKPLSKDSLGFVGFAVIDVGGLPFRQEEWKLPVVRREFGQVFATPTSGVLETSRSTPFSQTEWANPTVKVAQPQPRNLQRSNVLDVVVGDPFSQTNWPVPVTRLGGVSITTNTREASLGTPVVDPPFRQNEWSNPTKAAQRPQFVVQRSNALTETPVVDLPFRQSIWENPRLRPFFRKNVEFIAYYVLDVFDELPFRQEEWKLPVRVKPAGQIVTQRFKALDGTVVAGDPFRQNDWANPTRPAAPPPRLGASSVIVDEVVATTDPFKQVDWPNPRVKPLTILKQNAAVVYSDEIVGAPFVQTDWANPTRAKLTVQPVQRPALTLATVVPFAQLNWSNPNRRLAAGLFFAPRPLQFNGATAYSLAADSGVYTFTGTAANLKIGYRLVSNSGSYTFTGTASSLEVGRVLAAASGSYAISGTDAAFKWAHRLVAEGGSYTISGTDAALLIGQAAEPREINGLEASVDTHTLLASSDTTFTLTVEWTSHTLLGSEDTTFSLLANKDEL